MAAKTKEVTFKAPEGFTLPDGTNPGDTFQDMASLRANDDGTLTILEVDGLAVGAPVAAEPDDDDEEEGDDEGAAPAPATPPPAKKKKARMGIADRMAAKYSKAMGGV